MSKHFHAPSVLSQKELKRILCFNSNTGVFTWKVSRANNAIKIGSIAGCIDPNGYIVIRYQGKAFLAHRLVFLYLYGYYPENQIDHIDRDPGNNIPKNLREVTTSCNMRNSNLIRSNNSGVKGVYRCNTRKKWVATVYLYGKRCHLGNYVDFGEAVCARLAGEQSLNWEYCDKNSTAFQYVNNSILQGGIQK